MSSRCLARIGPLVALATLALAPLLVNAQMMPGGMGGGMGSRAGGMPPAGMGPGAGRTIPSFPRANEVAQKNVVMRLLAEKEKLALDSTQLAAITAIGDSLFTRNGDALVGYDQAQRAIKPPANNQSQPDEESMKSYMASLPVMKEALDLVVTNEERAAEQVAALLQPAQQERAKGIIGKRRGQLESWREPLKRIPARGARRPDGTMPAGAPPR